MTQVIDYAYWFTWCGGGDNDNEVDMEVDEEADNGMDKEVDTDMGHKKLSGHKSYPAIKGW